MNDKNRKWRNNLSNARKNMQRGMLKGLRLAAALVKSESMKRTPVDEGNLKASHYVNVLKTKHGAAAEIGCTAEYATPVHENLESYHTVGEAKFLEKAVMENETEIRKIIARNTDPK